ncbi:MAG: hypothetical protein V2J02_01925 [Pseudomonadales bacterium]|jgi:hypothetical protein|nr:hypothetical protein [Pseudomonadales bacterium]
MHPDRKLLLRAFVALLLVVGIGCGEDRIAAAAPTVERDLARLMDAWDAGRMEEFHRLLNADDYLPDRDAALAELGRLRRRLGVMEQTAGFLIDDAPEDPAAWVVAHQPMAMTRGVLRLSLAYDRELRIVGFHLDSGTRPGAGR